MADSAGGGLPSQTLRLKLIVIVPDRQKKDAKLAISLEMWQVAVADSMKGRGSINFKERVAVFMERRNPGFSGKR